MRAPDGAGGGPPADRIAAHFKPLREVAVDLPARATAS